VGGAGAGVEPPGVEEIGRLPVGMTTGTTATVEVGMGVATAAGAGPPLEPVNCGASAVGSCG
jgi:hypothetical protein